MKQTINENQFIDAFEKLRPNNFTYEGLSSLYNYLEEFENDTDKEVELDVIAICCDYTQYKNLKEYNEDYQENCKTIEDVQNITSTVNIDNKSFIISNY
tara:strand:+ start:654 stop:950 length:297 start_codon:yes stop_codon:yes gene_type:complete